MKTLVFGIGNIGRGDDALGVLCARQIKVWCAAEKIPDVEVREVFQLAIEEAEHIGRFDQVLFCDASVADVDEVALLPVTPARMSSFPTHASSPEEILAVAGLLFGPTPEAHVLHLRGEAFGFGDELSRRAKENLEKGFRQAVSFLHSQ